MTKKKWAVGAVMQICRQCLHETANDLVDRKQIRREKVMKDEKVPKKKK